jgi:predicted PurR-regulated permease PerM
MGKEKNDITFHISTGTVIKIIVISILFVVLFLLKDLVLVVLAAIVVASSIEPITKWFISKRIPRLPSVMIIYFSLAVMLVGGFYFLILPLLNDSSSFLSSLPQYINQGSMSIQGSDFVQSKPIFKQISDGISFENFSEQGSKILSSFASGFWNTVSVVFGSLLSFILIIVLSFYLAVQDDGVGKFLKIISSRRHENYITDLWKRADVKIGLWMQGQLLLVVIIGVLVYLGLALFGVRHALLLAVLAGLFELIPLFGPILAAIPAILIGFVDGGISMGLLIFGFYLVIQQFENQLIYPLVVKKVVGVPPIVVIIALVAGAQLAGFLGMMLSVPLAAIIMELVNDLEKEKISEEGVK